jgi:ATP-dependent helicase/nuclease subunit A
VVVEACAGAGKTWMLVSRILRALLDGVEPEQILAITFTRKAAGEMQARLDEWLLAFSTAASSPADRVAALRQRGLDAATAERLAPALGELRRRLLRRPRGVEVRTFHAWFAQLAGQLPLQLRLRLDLPAEPTLLEDVSPLHDELFRRFQRRVHADDALRDDHDQLVLKHRRSAVQDWLDTAWRRGDELELADRHGVLDGSMPDAAALDARCAGLDHPVQLLAAAAVQQAWQGLARELVALKGVKSRSAGEALGLALEAAQRGDLAPAFARAWARCSPPPARRARAWATAPPCRRWSMTCGCCAACAISSVRTTTTNAWCGCRACCGPSTVRSSAAARWSTWPTWSARRWRCCPTRSPPAGCSSGWTCASSRC